MSYHHTQDLGDGHKEILINFKMWVTSIELKILSPLSLLVVVVAVEVVVVVVLIP